MLSRFYRYLLMSVVCACICLFATIGLSQQVRAAADPITVSSQTDTVSFPKEIDFQMSATDSVAPITGATIYITDDTTTGNASPHEVQVANSANSVSLQWQENTSGSKFITPGTVIRYYWRITDKAQNVHIQAPQTFTVTDTRFGWQHLTQGMVQVNWYDRPASFGQLILTQAENSIKRIDSNLGGGLLHPINLWVYETNDDFHGSLPPGSYEWVGGVAFPELNQASISVETAASTTLIRDMPHELTHLIFHQLVSNKAIVPLWFDEGMAVYNQAYHEPAMKLQLKQALNSHSLLRLDDITQDFPADANKAYLAYAQSWNLLGYMYTTFGQSKMATLIKDINTDAHFDDDLSQALGVDQLHLENQWRLSLNQSATLAPGQANPVPVQHPIQVHVATNPFAPLLLMVGIILFMLPLLGLGGLFTYQRRNRPRVGLTTQAQNIINTTLPPYSAPFANPAPYSPPPMYQPYPPRPGQYAPPPNTPPLTNNRGNGQAGGAWPPGYRPGEYINRRPNNQAPQE